MRLKHEIENENYKLIETVDNLRTRLDAATKALHRAEALAEMRRRGYYAHIDARGCETPEEQARRNNGKGVWDLSKYL